MAKNNGTCEASEGEAQRSQKTIYNGNYKEIYSDNIHRIRRSYEGHKFYFMVFSPYNNTYDSNLEWYQSKALDAVVNKMKNLGCSLVIGTRELVDCAKTHINILCVSNIDLTTYDGRSSHNKFRIYCQEAKNREEVFDYIFKESKTRHFIRYQDYRVNDDVRDPVFPNERELIKILQDPHINE